MGPKVAKSPAGKQKGCDKTKIMRTSRSQTHKAKPAKRSREAPAQKSRSGTSGKSNWEKWNAARTRKAAAAKTIDGRLSRVGVASFLDGLLHNGTQVLRTTVIFAVAGWSGVAPIACTSSHLTMHVTILAGGQVGLGFSMLSWEHQKRTHTPYGTQSITAPSAPKGAPPLRPDELWPSGSNLNLCKVH